MVNINIEVPDELHREAKIAAAVAGTTLKGLIIAALEASVENDLEGFK